MNSVTKPVDKYEEKENIRRSNRIRKTTTLNNCTIYLKCKIIKINYFPFSAGIFVIGKDKKKLLKKRHDRVKTRNIKKGKRKNLSEALFSEKIRNGTNTAKRKKLTTGSSNIQAFKGKKRIDKIRLFQPNREKHFF